MINGLGPSGVHTPEPGRAPTSAKPDLNAILLMVGIESIKATQESMKLNYDKVVQNNREMENFNAAMRTMRTEKRKCSREHDPKFTETKFDITLPDGSVKKISLADFMQRYPQIPLSHRDEVLGGKSGAGMDGGVSSWIWEDALENVRSFTDSKSGSNQLDVQNLNALVSRMNDMANMVSSNMSKIAQQMLTISGNMR